MLGVVQHENTRDSDTFSAATLFYTRLRRVTGHVVDVRYLVENKEYSKYVIEIAMKTNDLELDRLIQRLYDLLNLDTVSETPVNVESLEMTEPEYISEATADEIYQAQVSHHYIGALR